MTVWYLIFAILLNTGQPAQTIAHPFTTQAECEAVGAGASADLVMNTEVDRAAWQCLKIDFSKADPKPAPKHIPGMKEASYRNPSWAIWDGKGPFPSRREA